MIDFRFQGIIPPVPRGRPKQSEPLVREDRPTSGAPSPCVATIALEPGSELLSACARTCGGPHAPGARVPPLRRATAMTSPGTAMRERKERNGKEGPAEPQQINKIITEINKMLCLEQEDMRHIEYRKGKCR